MQNYSRQKWKSSTFLRYAKEDFTSNAPQGGSITDYSCELFGHVVGVSVTRFAGFVSFLMSHRAMSFRKSFSAEEAQLILYKKLIGISQSSKNGKDFFFVFLMYVTVLPKHRWKKQILHIWAQNEAVADVIQNEFIKLEPQVQGGTVLLVTVTKNAEWIFKSSHQSLVLP